MRIVSNQSNIIKNHFRGCAMYIAHKTNNIIPYLIFLRICKNSGKTYIFLCDMKICIKFGFRIYDTCNSATSLKIFIM